MRALLCALAVGCVAADFPDVNPAVFPVTDPRAKDLSRITSANVQLRMQEANLRESAAFAAVDTIAKWEAYRDQRIRALRESLGTGFVRPRPQLPTTVVTNTLIGDGFAIRKLVYETRPGLWVSANLYLPVKSVRNMPGILISHSHHTSKTNGELQDMGMTWARSGVAVLVPDHLGHGERRQHDFRTEKDYPTPFRASRQDYYFRFNSNLQLSVVGESLMGWMVWDLMRGVDVLLHLPGIDAKRIILLGAVAGGGDPAGVTAALDPRIACVVPFNFGGWQPESNRPENPDRDFPWFGDGYWESTRGLRGGAAGGYAHFTIVGSVAPRKVIYAHEFAWNPEKDPAYPRLKTIFGFYDAADSLRIAHGTGSLKGQPPESSHCTHIGAVHRKMIYPALKDWFGMPIPEEYSQRRPSEDLLCWADDAKRALQPKKLHEILGKLADKQFPTPRKIDTKFLGSTEPTANPKLIEGTTEAVPGGTLARFALEAEPGIVVPLLLITPQKPTGKPSVVVMVSSTGKQAFLKERGDVIAAFLKAGFAVCLPDVRGTGETRIGSGSPSRGSSRTSIAQSSLILGQSVIGLQLRDLRTVIRWLGTRSEINGKSVAMWGDSFAATNPVGKELAVPLDAGDYPAIAEPSGSTLTELATMFEPTVKATYSRGGLSSPRSLLDSPYVYVPFESVVPIGDIGTFGMGGIIQREALVDGRNRPIGNTVPPLVGVEWVRKQLAE